MTQRFYSWALGCLGVLALGCDDASTHKTETQPNTGVDCAGVIGGQAQLDDCGTCVGGNTGKEACTADCAGVPGGKAQLDACGQCVAEGSTSCQKDCHGDPGGSAIVDACGDCVAGNTGKAPCKEQAPDCAGVPGGSAYFDACHECVGGNTNRTECSADCAGKPGGQAFVDACGECVAGDTGKTPCTMDCHGDSGGLAFVDQCGQCVGGNTGKTPCGQNCEGEFGGGAHVDPCGICVGGDTGKQACTQDCNGVWGGSAYLDDCSVCVGGNTGKQACTADCTGKLGGSAVIDHCGDCTGGSTGKDACPAACDGSWGGSARIDDCGRCVGGSTGLAACVKDCNGDFGGSARVDDCGTCVEGKTGKPACQRDCNGDFGGTAEVDHCAVCTGGKTGKTACVKDCHGDFGGLAQVDQCGVCAGGNTRVNPCVKDCHGDYGGSAFIDGCGQCVGGNTGASACNKDCHGDLGGSASYDNCHVCVGGKTGKSACTQDCAGQWGGKAFIDGCHQCVGGTTGKSACTEDCNGDLGGSAKPDQCGQCSGGNSGHNPCTADCAGTLGGSAHIDDCGTCVEGTTGKSACEKDCAGVFGGSAALDSCGVCSGGNSGHAACVKDCNGDFGGSARVDTCGTCVEGKTGKTACVPGQCTIGQGYLTIQSAINDTKCKVILAGAGTFHERLQIGRTLLIRGAGRNQTIIDGDGLGSTVRMFVRSTDSVQFESLSVTGGRADIGAGIYSNDGELHLIDTDVHHNQLSASSVPHYGAGIYKADGVLTLNNSTVVYNSCLSCSGAGMYLSKVRVTLEGSSVAHNQIPQAQDAYGAGVYADRGTLTAKSSHFDANSITISPTLYYRAEGGAVWAQGTNLDFDGCTLSDNVLVGSGYEAGAALYATDFSSIALRNTEVLRNAIRSSHPPSLDAGGVLGVGSESGTVVLENVSVENNQIIQTSTSGEQVVNMGSLLSISGSLTLQASGLRVRKNIINLPSGWVDGGLLYFNGPLSAHITEAEISGNTIASYNVNGGVLHAASDGKGKQGVVLDRSLVTANNIVPSVGSFSTGLFHSDGANVVVQNSTVHQNFLQGGRDVATIARGGCTFINATVTFNQASGATGHGQPFVGALSAYHSVFSDNTGADAIACNGDAFAVTVAGHHNWFNDTQRCESSTDPSSTFGQDPLLYALADNGGATRSRMPAPVSPLINAGDSTCSTWDGNPPNLLDQRANARPQGGACDVGSIEIR